MSALELALRAIPAPLFGRLAALQHRPGLAQPLLRWGARRLPRRVGRIAHGPAQGFWFDCGASLLSYLAGTSEPAVQRALSLLAGPGDTVWDIGANVGFFTLVLARAVGPAGRVIAFEPEPRNAEILRRNVARNGLTQVDVVEAAVSGNSGTETLWIGGGSTVAKLASTNSRRPDTEQSANVEVLSLDDAWRSQRFGRPSFIKMDIEGAEVAALQGGLDFLRNTHPLLLCELHGTNVHVADLLDSVSYCCVPLEDPAADVRTGFWNLHLLAFPESRRARIRALFES